MTEVQRKYKEKIFYLVSKLVFFKTLHAQFFTRIYFYFYKKFERPPVA